MSAVWQDARVHDHRVTVVIPTWNGLELLERLLPTLRAQTLRERRTIVVDNGSEDGTAVRLAADWPEVEVLRFAENRGFAPAVNAGVALATGDYVALLNNDMELHPEWLATLVRALDAAPHAAAATPKQLSARHPGRLDGAGDVLGWTGAAMRRGAGELDRGQYDTPGPVFGASGGAALYRRRALQEVGAFEESFFAYLEDVDWSFRAQIAGWTALYVPDAVVHHLGGATSERMPGRERYLVTRNHVTFVLRNLPTSWLVRFAPLITAELGRTLLVALRSRQGRIVLRAWRDALRRLPVTLSERRRIQATRNVPLAELEIAVFGARRTRRELFTVRPRERVA